LDEELFNDSLDRHSSSRKIFLVVSVPAHDSALDGLGSSHSFGFINANLEVSRGTGLCEKSKNSSGEFHLVNFNNY
jgi:hypothetical protein